MIGVVGFTAHDFLSIGIAAFAGVVLMVLTGCLKPADAVSWKVIFLIVVVTTLGIAFIWEL